MKTEKITEGVNLRFVPVRHFKTNRITVFFRTPIKRENVTKISLLRQVMKRGSVNYPTITEIAKELEEMYGANLSGGIRKKGDTELFYFSVEYIADRFTGENLTDRAISLLREIIFNPYTENGGFSEEYLKQEKVNLKNYIDGIINDKREYAQVRCLSEMFEGDPYGIFEYGYIEDFDGITSQNLYEFYKDIISKANIEVFVSGTFDDEKVSEKIKKEFMFSPREQENIETQIIKNREDVKHFTERMDVTQSKLCIGFSCDTDYKSVDYYAFMLYNMVLGGSPYSKLFNNVREKMSLAYYVSSRIDKMKGFMLISSGIENDKYDDAYKEIMNQMQKILMGDISDSEIFSAKKALSNSINSLRDSLVGMEDFYMSGIICDRNESLAEIIKNINEVNKADISAVGKKVKTHTIYFLTGKEEA